MHKKRLIIDRPYIGAIVMTFLLFLGISVLGLIPSAIMDAFINIGTEQCGEICIVIMTFVVLLLYRLWLRREHFRGVLSVTGQGVSDVLRLALVIFICDIICITAVLFLDYGGVSNLVLPSVATFLTSLCAGTFEEVTFRAIPLSILMKNKPTTRRIILAVILTSVIFGGVHMFNMEAGTNLVIAIYQSSQAVIIGAMFAAFYLRTGSIILSMAFHFMHDLLSLMLPEQSTGVMLQQSIRIGTLIPDMVLITCQIIVTIYLLRPSKMESIKETWRVKWSESIDL